MKCVDFTVEDKVPCLSPYQIKERLRSGVKDVRYCFELSLDDLIEFSPDALYHFVCEKVTGIEESLDEVSYSAVSVEDNHVIIFVTAKLDLDPELVAFAQPPTPEWENDLEG